MKKSEERLRKIQLSPRELDKRNPFTDEFGVQKESDSDEFQDTFVMEYGGEWQPIMASTKKAIWDNMEVPGSPYMGRDREQGNGSPETGMGEPYPNISKKEYIHPRWFNIENLPVILSPRDEKAQETQEEIEQIPVRASIKISECDSL